MTKPGKPTLTTPPPSRQKLIISKRLAKYLESGLVALTGIGVWLLYRDYGMSWDSEVHAAYGERVLNYFLSGLKDLRCNTESGVLPYYGTLFDLPSAALHRWAGIDRHTWRALLSALCAVATLPAVMRLGRLLGNERLALFAAGALLLTPQFFGQAFINSKDIPLACAVTWAVLAICRLAMSDHFDWGKVLGVAIACGITLGLRVGAVFVLVFLAAALFARFCQQAVQGNARTVLPTKPQLGSVLLKIFVGLVVLWVLMVVAWPYAHQNLLLNPIRAFRAATDFPVAYPVLFKGKFILSNELPAGYLPVYFTLILPPALLGLAWVGAMGAVVTLFRRWRERTSLVAFVILFWIGFPLAYVFIARPNIYDAVRHFIFLLPAFALLMGWGADLLVAFTERFWGRVAASVVLGAVAIATAVPLVRWHPYQYAYLNALAGDRATLHERFETDYWVTSYKAAAQWINQQQKNRGAPLRVLAAVNDHSHPCLAHFLDKKIQLKAFMRQAPDQAIPAEFDYYVGTVRYGLDRNFSRSPVVWEERRDGVLFCVIRGEQTAPSR